MQDTTEESIFQAFFNRDVNYLHDTIFKKTKCIKSLHFELTIAIIK